MAAFKVASKIKELRFLFCQTGKSSEGIRNFIDKNYVSMKRANPKLPMLIRECSGTKPRIFVRAEFGKETCIPVADVNASDIATKLKAAASQ